MSTQARQANSMIKLIKTTLRGAADVRSGLNNSITHIIKHRIQQQVRQRQTRMMWRLNTNTIACRRHSSLVTRTEVVTFWNSDVSLKTREHAVATTTTALLSYPYLKSAVQYTHVSERFLCRGHDHSQPVMEASNDRFS
jgi:hypothetical protein